MLMYLQKVISIKNCFFVGVVKVKDGNNRIRSQIRIQWSEAWIRIRTKCHGFTTLVYNLGTGIRKHSVALE
jgi:hypothetical protein